MDDWLEVIRLMISVVFELQGVAQPEAFREHPSLAAYLTGEENFRLSDWV
ncbi:hypothetical protein [Metapseudomonas furukawaii]